MEVITDFESRQLFLSRSGEKTAAPLLYNSKDEQVQQWPQYPGYSVIAWHPATRRLVLNSQWIKGSRKLVTRLVVMNIDTQEEVYSTERHMYYNALFNGAGTHLLLEAYNQKPLWVDLLTGDAIAVLPSEIRLANGTYNPEQDVFYFPLEKKKAYLRVDGADFSSSLVKTPYSDKVDQLVFTNGQYLVLTEGNLLFCCDQQFRPIWQRNFSDMGGDSGRVTGTGLVVTEDDQLLCISASSTESNRWGVEYILYKQTGEVRNTLPGEQGRGRVAGGYFDHQVLLFTMKLLDLQTGAVADFLPGFK
ncbi:hypothetical protein [Chitinophaga arvensicola]|uniref:TolB-like 6-blade propeller-like n=1 Tax=Chitinophaga arvensicola TaxID=29529 RepID=A0A1I0S7V5_9BACT|nr:hypothetical protein [Chitinophaga arvensicola]SEW51896.1 hypothetical protein SAMN04488122_4571 [Chitinophaga arvensicola]